MCAACCSRFAPRLPRCRQCALARVGLATGDGSAKGQTDGRVDRQHVDGRVEGRCGACLVAPPAYSHAVAAADYGFPWDRLIARLKFEQAPELARPLAELLAQAAGERIAQPGWPRPDLVLPVPLAPRRQAERGYNQAWELARRIAPRLGLKAEPLLLERWRETPHQVGASRAERLRNLGDAFLVDPARRAALAGRRIALVDDVLTTGVTAQAAAQALLAAGAADVQVWVIARTPPPEDRDTNPPDGAATIG